MDFKAKRIVLSRPGQDKGGVMRDIVYKSAGDLALKADLYLPEGVPSGARLPTVIFVHGDGPREILSDAKDWGQYRSWAELAAADGFAAVTFTHRSTDRLAHVAEAAGDVVDLITYIRAHAAAYRIDPERMGLWVCSAGGPVGLTPVLNGQAGSLRCAAALYALLDIPAERVPPGASPEWLGSWSPAAVLEGAPGPVVPLLVVRAGQDHPDFSRSASRFGEAALAKNIDLTLINYPAGVHGFDLENDEERSRQIIAAVLAFFHTHLGG